MSSSTPACRPNGFADKPSNNPFNTVFDGEETDDEWWDEEDMVDSTHEEPPSNIRVTQWPRPPEMNGLGLVMKPVNGSNTRKSDKRYSVQKPTRDKSKGRQKKLLAKAGIKVVTNSPQQGSPANGQLPGSQTVPEMARFVDYATLKALGGETPGGFWKGKKSRVEAVPAMPNGASSTHHMVAGRSKGLAPSPCKANDDLSPNDRPIVIGISIPTGDLAGHTLSPQTASSETSNIVRAYAQRSPAVPDTPTIIITPAQESPSWPPRPPSSVYSDPHFTATDAPPVPRMPFSVLEDERQRVAAQRSYFSPDSDDVTSWGDDTPTTATKSRVMSSCTIFEEDESPIIARAGRATSFSAVRGIDNRLSISTVGTARRSKGWWNYITTPFLTRSNTFANREVDEQNPPALPSLAIAAAKAQDAERDGKSWEKEFSPLTPETSLSINSDPWWQLDQKDDKKQSPIIHETRHKAQTSTGTLPMVLSEVAILASASQASLVSEAQLSLLNISASLASVQSKEEESRQDSQVAISALNNNPSVQPRSPPREDPQSSNRQAMALAPGNAAAAQPVKTPPPPYSPSPSRQKPYRADFPPGHVLGTQQPGSPGPVSPGLQQATMSSGGGIPLSNVPLTPPARRPINLNSGYQPELPTRSNGNFSSDYLNAAARATSEKARKVEEKRRRHEKEDAVAHKAGGLWRGRGCVSDRGCYGRSGAEGRKRRRWWFALIILFLFFIILAVVFATTLHRKSNTAAGPSQWLNLTGFPPIFLGLSTVIAPVNIKTNTGCVFPATQWSCDLPKDLQPSNSPSPSNQPNFFLQIQWDNSSEANSTFSNVTGNQKLGTRAAGNPVTAGQFIRHLLLRARQITQIIPSPAPPSFAEDAFLGSTTDGIASGNKAGEPTPFYISFLPKAGSAVSKRELQDRDSPFPNITAAIPAPSLNADGTAAPANLLPFPTQQPIRLYDRGLPTEHYGFYTYFDRSIFLKSLVLLNSSNIVNGEVPDDLNGGALENAANFRCTWTQTRFLVQMWTRMNTTAQLNNPTSSSSPKKNAETDLRQPGSFPYPITITLDRHGGEPAKKMLYCYGMNAREGIVASTGQLVSEDRGFGGQLINPAAMIFTNGTNTALGGFDGGNGGCSCQWNNFVDVLNG